MKYYLPLLLLLTASACSTVRTLPVQDSTRVEVRYETKTVHDTAYVELPVIVEKVATLDTASLLENKYAKSAASVCLFFIPPLGEIASSAVSIVSELLVLCGAILGVKASYDVKFRKFEAELREVIENEKQPTT